MSTKTLKDRVGHHADSTKATGQVPAGENFPMQTTHGLSAHMRVFSFFTLSYLFSLNRKSVVDSEIIIEEKKSRERRAGGLTEKREGGGGGERGEEGERGRGKERERGETDRQTDRQTESLKAGRIWPE